MSKLNVVEISELRTEKAGSVRTDGKASRQHYTLRFSSVENPLTNRGQRNFFQDHSPDGKTAFWKSSASYSEAKGLIGTQVSGQIMKLEVEPYEINGKMVNTYKCIVLEGEDPLAIARAAGHEVVGTLPAFKKEEVIL